MKNLIYGNIWVSASLIGFSFFSHTTDKKNFFRWNRAKNLHCSMQFNKLHECNAIFCYKRLVMRLIYIRKPLTDYAQKYHAREFAWDGVPCVNTASAELREAQPVRVYRDFVAEIAPRSVRILYTLRLSRAGEERFFLSIHCRYSWQL